MTHIPILNTHITFQWIISSPFNFKHLFTSEVKNLNKSKFTVVNPKMTQIQDLFKSQIFKNTTSIKIKVKLKHSTSRKDFDFTFIKVTLKISVKQSVQIRPKIDRNFDSEKLDFGSSRNERDSVGIKNENEI